MQVADGLAAVFTDVGDDAVTVSEPECLCHFGDCLHDAADDLAVFRGDLIDGGNVFFGTIRTWTGACGCMSRKANTASFSYTLADGISPAMILQNRQSMIVYLTFDLHIV